MASYLIGFALSIILTLAAYFLVVQNLLNGWNLLLVLVALALLQLIVQLRFFLHLGEESKPYWNFLSFCFTVLVVGILVAGTLWIMYELDYRTMAPMGAAGEHAK